MYALQREPEEGRRLRVMVAGSIAVALLFTATAGITSRIDVRRTTTAPRRVQMRVVHTAPVIDVPEAPAKPPAVVPEPVVPLVANKPPAPSRKPPAQAKPMPPIAATAPGEQVPASAAAPPPLIVGLTLSSTARTGRGPRFAVGNTLMGTPDTKATTPKAGGLVHGVKPIEPAAAPLSAPQRHASSKLRRAAKLKSGNEPKYPQDARREGVEGVVVLSITINAKGRVESAQVLRGLGFGLDESALRAARTTIWSPATVGSQSVRSTRRFNVRFTLQS